jgi:low temperature requirement protein LtrA
VTAEPVEIERPVAPLELFFDLVFVFAFTQVTTLLSDNPTWSGLGHALLILTAVWAAWASYAWLTNTIDAEVDLVLFAVLVATGAMFMAALAVPDVFGRHGVLFGVAFLLVNAMQVALYVLGARAEHDLLDAVLRVLPWVLGGSVLILIAGFVHGGARTGLWLAALAVGFAAPGLLGVRGFRVQPAHFAERHGLIVIIAIGESLVAIGIGARHTTLDAGAVGTAVLGLAVAISFWLSYFDFFAIRGRQLLAARSGADRTALARDLYTYLHLPMVAGVILFAFAMKVALANRGDELGTIEAVALCGGPALYLFSFVAVRYRVSRGFGRGRLTAAVACAVLIPVAREVPAVAALALLAGVWIALHAYELIWFREARAETRSQQHAAPV